MKKIAQRMVVIDGQIYRVKHQSLCGSYLYFVADGQAKLDPKVMWEFSAANERPVTPILWYEDDASFREYHLSPPDPYYANL